MARVTTVDKYRRQAINGLNWSATQDQSEKFFPIYDVDDRFNDYFHLYIDVQKW